MVFERRIRHFSPGPADYVGEISTRAISGCWFELHRRGGCGDAELVLLNDFADRYEIEIGDWIAFEAEEGVRWYLGRVEERESRSPAGVLCRLTGMAVELGEIYPGGFSRTFAYKVPPHRFAQTDLFPGDPDYSDETVDVVSQAPELAWLLLDRYANGQTHIQFDIENFSPLEVDSPVMSVKFRGEESLRSILKDLAMRNRDAAWGVNAEGEFYFQPNGTTLQKTLREGVDLLSLKEVRNLDQVYNRILLTGDYVYDAEQNSEVPANGFYRWRGTYVQPFSRSQYGDRRIRMWIPWIRSQTDAHQFVTEFFRVYAKPSSRYEIEVAGIENMILPWAGLVRLEDREGNELDTAPVETVRVQFDAVPRYELSVGPELPQELWPEPEHDERWEINRLGGGGGVVTFSSEVESSSGSDDSYESSSASSDPVSSSSEESSEELTSSESGTSTSDSYGSDSSSVVQSSSDGTDSSSDGGSNDSDSEGASESDGDSSGAGSGSDGSTGGSGSDSWSGDSTEEGSGGSGYSTDASEESSASGLCAQAIFDSFDDTNGTSLVSHPPDIAPSGAAWIDPGLQYQIQSGRARFIPTDADVGRARIASGSQDVQVSANIQAGTILRHGDEEWLGAVGLVLRAASDTSYCAVLVEESYVRLVQVTGGVATNLDSEPHGIAVGATFTVSAVCDGTSITATVAGVTVAATGVTASGGQYGLYAENTDDVETHHEFPSFSVNCL
ncbi:MAG: hypothetical protein CMJ46_04970 [Planctomyces sp.]|nr:hypothetical protein [Planctomyces sp.]